MTALYSSTPALLAARLMINVLLKTPALLAIHNTGTIRGTGTVDNILLTILNIGTIQDTGTVGCQPNMPALLRTPALLGIGLLL